MKFLLIALGATLAMSSLSFANQIIIDGQQSQYKTLTTAEVTHTEYRQEERQATCSRQVPYGSHQECEYVGGGEECHYVGGGRECHMVGGGQECGLTPTGRVCHYVPGHQECFQVPGQRQCYSTPGYRQCRDVTDYRTEYYSCTQTISVPYIVKDSDIQNNVTVNVEINRNLPAGLHEVLDLVQSGQTLTINSVQSTGKVLVYATQKQTIISNNGRLVQLQTEVSVKMLDRAVVLGAFLSPMSDLTIDAHHLEVTTGLIVDPAAVHFDIDLRRKKLFGKDEVVLQKALTTADATLTNRGQQTVVSFDFQKLGIQDRVAGKKVHVTLQLQSNLVLDNIINRQDIPAAIGSSKKEIDQRL